MKLKPATFSSAGRGFPAAASINIPGEQILKDLVGGYFAAKLAGTDSLAQAFQA